MATADDNAAQIRAQVRNEHGESESAPVTLSVEKAAEPTESTKPTESAEPTDETKPAEPSTQPKPGSSNSSELGGLAVAGVALAVFGAILSQFAHIPGIDQMIARIRDFLSNFGIRF